MINPADLLEPLAWSQSTILCLLVLLLPLFSFIVIAILPNTQAKASAWVGMFMTLIASIISVHLLIAGWQGAGIHSRVEWFSFGHLPPFTVGVLLNDPALLMLVVVTVISFLVHLFSTAYMAGDAGYKKYFGFLGLFTFSMLGIILADNVLVIFIFWELVGLSSYLLISHWNHKESAIKAAKKAFIVNRVGDVGFIIGLAILWSQFNTLDLEALKVLMQASTIENGQWIAGAHSVSLPWLTAAGICLFLGAMGKSAQFPLQVWLPDAMEGPTPVSALIHAATMVAAGVYLMARVFPLMSIDALTFVAIIGSVTAFMGAIAALAQHDIKKVLAFSTISQLGYMLMGMGVGAYDAALFHLFTHAFFKACLFLSAGAIIHALHDYAHRADIHFDAQDMRNMGGLRKYLPFTFIAYLVSTLALIGIPFFSGYLSKDALLSGAYAWADLMSERTLSWHYLVPDLGFITVVLTALYMVRQLLLVFFGDFRIADERSIEANIKVKDVPWVMKTALSILALMSFGFIWSLNPLNHSLSWFLSALKTPTILVPGMNGNWQNNLVELAEHNHMQVTVISVFMIVIGGLVAWFIYRPKGKYAINYFSRQGASNVWQWLSFNNWYLDEIYNDFIIQPIEVLSQKLQLLDTKVIDNFIDKFAIFNIILGHLTAWVDRNIVDGLVNFSVYFVGRVGLMTKSMQGGKVQSYIALAFVGILIFIFWIIW
ncbi:NADH-quinone oxidoreductase subunit L [Fulvivirga sediminis]|uniref:NADH-quinone oxidoreductase subunit L n=1 Tax=Fulvivirga sediminis TaxID=2803949 RepID=A0A937F893_9BACT|nr:NADH-quinone oxidoreductase subunit L [Fulvivirga sediminis]MBL3657545.1 NADH-quinone oxidoreductase subunit L [Fulvivirga sediminis]